MSGSYDKSLRVWDLESGACLHTLKGHSGPVSCGTVTPDGRNAVSGSHDNSLRVGDLESGACLRTLILNWMTMAWIQDSARPRPEPELPLNALFISSSPSKQMEPSKMGGNSLRVRRD